MRRIAALLGFLAVAITATTPLAGQVPNAPARAKFVGPDWLIGGGVLRCNVNDRAQLILEATTASGGRVDLTRFQPTIRSSDENAVNAVVDENPASNHVLCADNGRSEVTLKIGTLTLCIPVLSGTAQTEDSTPCGSGFGMLATSSGKAPTMLVTSSGGGPRSTAPAAPARAHFVGPDWLIGKGSLGCKPGSQWQLVLDVTTQKLQRADLKFYPPRVSSSEESVAKGVLDADPYSLQVHCAAEGRSDVTVTIGTVAICIPVIVSEDAPAETASCTPTSAQVATSQQTTSPPTGTQQTITQTKAPPRAPLSQNASRVEDAADGITTTIADAVSGDPAKDGFTPREAQRSLMTLQRTANGAFVLQPGYYALNAQSYSVTIGSRAPAANTGYLYAPAIGSAKDAV
ncbi:MAG TPA: hypothetical protein VF470_01095, partial [Sphingomicrobium sp.]